MAIGISKRSVRSVIQSAGRNRSTNLIKRSFHKSNFLSQKHNDDLDDKLNKEIKKLKELKENYNKAGLFEKFKLRPGLFEQELKITEAQSNKLIDESISTPTIDPEHPLDIASIERYKVVYKYMLNSFLDQCKIFATNPKAVTNVSPDVLIEEITELFKKVHKDVEPITKHEVLFYFHIYYALSNNLVFLDELKFQDETVQKFLNSYANMTPTDDRSTVVEQISKSYGISNPDVVEGWFDIFDTLSSTPFKEGTERMTCPLCPYEYSQYQTLNSEFDNLKKKFNYDDAFKSFNFGNPSQKPSGQKPKSESNRSEKSSKDKSDKPKTVEFELNLNGSPFRYFQVGTLIGLLVYILYNMSSDRNKEITFQEFTSKFLNKNLVSKIIVVNNRTAIIELNENGKHQFGQAAANGAAVGQGHFYFTIGSVETFERSLAEAQDNFGINDQLRIPVIYTSEGSTGKMLVNFLPTVLFLGAIYYMTKKAGSMGGMGGPLGFGKSTAKKFNQETDVKIRFKDVAGMSEAKMEVMEFVKFLQNPDKYEKLGAKIPRGAILSGPPGTGKTLIAKATAGEAGVPFYSVSGSEFVEMFVGVGASRVRDLFKTARENAPSIVFVDEIDAIGKQRSKGNASGANDERETTLNQLLVEMDGFESSDHVVVLAGTNRADILDKALMRPGRFDRHIAIDNPELEGRKEIFQVHLKKITLADKIDEDLPGRLAALTPGFSGADIANVCNEAALIGARFNADAVTLRHFELAIERVIGGVEKKSKILNPEEQRIVAYHEAGHAVCGWYLKYAHPLLKVSIIPRGQGALGYAQYLPPDQYLMSELQLNDRMIMTLGGRVSEELHFPTVTSGAHDDFKKVTNIAQSMVLRFGMSKKVGMVNYADTQSSDNLTKPFSDETNGIIDQEIMRIVRECHQKCTQLLKEKAQQVELVAQELLKKEFITREDMIRLLGPRPFKETNDAFDKYLDGKAAFKNEKPAEEKKDDEK